MRERGLERAKGVGSLLGACLSIMMCFTSRPLTRESRERTPPFSFSVNRWMASLTLPVKIRLANQ